jgi:RNA polymerase sigma-70 factor (ECF subfamily)
LTDENLIEIILAGDTESFKELVKRYEGKVASVVIGMLGRGPEAEDVGQETFIRFYKALKRFRGESNIGTYLTRIAINLSLNELKRRKRSGGMFLRIQDGTDKIRVEQTDPLSFLEMNAVRSAIQQLKPDLRAVIVLRYIEDYSTNETASLLRVPLGTVLSRQARAKKILREILGDRR